MKGIALRVKGKVQGVGFRPFVWQIAHKLSVKGEVLNDGQGVLIRLLTEPGSASSATACPVESFLQLLRTELPPLAEIESLHQSDYKWESEPEGFSIVQSESTSIDTQVVPDAATCPECLRELLEKSADDRRYHYPFINCTHCGPRFTIIRALPYDRPKTVMSAFPMCPDCSEEYQNPADRRYHAQPVACPECGPVAKALYPDGTEASGDLTGRDWFELAMTALEEGGIIAIKSVGGFHLACDATNTLAVTKLRERKRRWYKPFAIMVRDAHQISEFACVTEHELEALQSRAAPIVLLNNRENTVLVPELAAGLNETGVMLPSNPVQHLIAQHFTKPVVMTSGNGTGLPPALDNQHALRELSQIADLFIIHNRDIVQRCDDSLIRIDEQGKQETLRRSRGFVPDAVNLPEGFPSADGYLAYGGDLKNAFALGKNNQIIVSQYLGDLANIETQSQYKDAIEHYVTLYDIQPEHHIADLHPGYFSHQHAASQTGETHLVQHHHAHVASCLVENQWPADAGKVLALALDGLGLGDDGTLWGAELLLADYAQSERLGGIPAVNLVGGDRAAREPWRSLYAHIQAFIPGQAEDYLKCTFADKPLNMIDIAVEKGINCHPVRSAGRLFDAIAASLGICFDHIEYEGLAACQLEALANRYNTREQIRPIKIGHTNLELNMAEFWQSFLTYQGDKAEKAYLFHLSLAHALVTIVIDAQKQNPEVTHLVLTGGVFHNALLTKLIKSAINNRMNILQHQTFSCGDGGLALGQLAIALMKNE